jgi:hypothetical protein
MFSAVSTRNPHTQEPGIHALSVSTDVQDEASVQALVRANVEPFGRVSFPQATPPASLLAVLPYPVLRRVSSTRVAALRRPSPCPGALRRVLPPRVRCAREYPGRDVSAGG